MRIISCFVLLIAFAFLASPQPLNGKEKTKPTKGKRISYYRQIRPIFQQHCHGCHQPAKQSGKYEMTAFKQLVKGGESEEPAVVPFQPERSYLMDQINAENGEAAMPKGKKPLIESQIKLIAAWIKQGGENDTPKSAKARYDMKHPPVYTAPPVITSVTYSPDGKWLAISGYHEVVVHRADKSGVVARLVGVSERIEKVSFSPKGDRLAVSGGNPGRTGELQVWDFQKRKLLLSVTQGHDTLYGASWSKDGKLVAFGCPDNTLRVVDVKTGKQVLFNGAHSGWVLDTIFSVKSDHVISVSRDRSMKLVHLKTQRFIDNITSITPGALKGGLHAIHRHPTKDELLCGGADGTPKIYRMIRQKARRIGDDFNLIRRFPKMTGRLFSVTFSRDGKRIAAGSSYNGKGEVWVYNYADAKVVAKTAIPDGGIFSVDFSKDGKQVVAAGFDGYVHILDATSGKVIRKFLPVPLKAKKVATAE